MERFKAGVMKISAFTFCKNIVKLDYPNSVADGRAAPNSRFNERVSSGKYDIMKNFNGSYPKVLEERIKIF